MSFSYHTFILKNDGTLWGCGHNGRGQLGLGDYTHRESFTQITTNVANIKSIYYGYYHTIILKNDSTLWGCGYNTSGELGLGDTNDRNIFTQITTNVKLACCGVNHAIILKNDGTLWTCGGNQFGQLGLGDTSNRNTLTQITANANDVKSIYCGWRYTLILKNDGTLWGCGQNGTGALGLGDYTNRDTFTQITTNVDNIKSVYCGGFTTFILKNDGTLWGSGYNSHGELGVGDTSNRNTFTQITANAGDIKSISCGSNHTFILKNDGTLWGCGLNDHGQLGSGDRTNRTTFTKITTNTNNTKLVHCGNDYTFILKNDGTLWSCGNDTYNQLALGNYGDVRIFTQVTKNVDNIKSFNNNYNNISNTTKTYDLNIGSIETLDTNNFRSISINTVEKLKSLCIKPKDTFLSCLISFDKKQTWKAFDGTNWNTISDISPANIILNGMEVDNLNKLDKSKLISGGFTGDLDFKIAMKTNDTSKTPSVTKIYIEYK